MDHADLGKRRAAVLVAAIFAAGLCSIVYELLIGTTSSYFLGDSIRQFSIVVGLFMAAMGLGSYVSRFTPEGEELRWFVRVEVLLGVVGGASVPLLYVVYAWTDLYQPAMVVLVVAIGALTGLEIPLLVRVMRRHFTLSTNLSNILSLDYFGALAATLLFPFVLLPMLGTFRSSLVVGVTNLAVAALVAHHFRDRLGQDAGRATARTALVTAAALLAGVVFADDLLRPWRNASYEDRVVFTQQTPYQKLVLTRGKHDVRLFLNGHLQFSAIDEHRYHEALVHPALAATPRRGSVLLLGGGDGLAVREVLKYADVERVTLVDLDPAVTELARNHPLLRKLNGDSLNDPRVRVVHQDAFEYVKTNEALHDVVLADLPDPNSASLSRLYSREFFTLLRRRLARSGVLVTQATSPYFAREAFWCIHDTLRDAGLEVRPYHAYVPSFGEWGFVLAAHHPIDPGRLRVQVPTRSLDDDVVASLFVFEKDLRAPATLVSTLDRPEVLARYLAGWKQWN